MNHQVEDNRDIGAPRVERRQTMSLDKRRLDVMLQHCLHSRVEPLDVADRRLDAFLLGEPL